MALINPIMRTGQLEIDSFKKDDKWDGPYEEYYENGELKTSTIFKNDEFDGVLWNYSN